MAAIICPTMTIGIITGKGEGEIYIETLEKLLQSLSYYADNRKRDTPVFTPWD